MSGRFMWIRRAAATFIVGLSYWIWTRHSDVIDLIVNERPVLFGRYSQGHVGTLILLTPILWILAAALASRRPLAQALGNAGLVIGSTLGSILLITYAAHFFHREANYVETHVDDARAQALHLTGVTRHRPPNERYTLTIHDAPEQARSYPDAPPGYPDNAVVFTIDSNGFRNQRVDSRYDFIAVGDSFVAGSQVSDDQMWSVLLAEKIRRPIYNLGVAGSGPITYLNNFAYFGVPLKPRVALFMLYEGNDFKEDVALENPAEPGIKQRIADHFDYAIHASPVTLGLHKLSQDIFEKLGAKRPIPEYRERMGWMPLAVNSGAATHYYAFPSKRLLYLDLSVDEFRNSPEWQFTRDVLDRTVNISRENSIEPIFVYAPSAPHVVLPLARDNIPAAQLRTFAAYKARHLPEAEAFKAELFGNLDSEENVVMNYCREKNLHCISLTQPLREAVAAGEQPYFTYDQHWTPVGNRVAAQTIFQALTRFDLVPADDSVSNP